MAFSKDLYLLEINMIFRTTTTTWISTVDNNMQKIIYEVFESVYN